MSAGNRVHLLSLAVREFRQLADARPTLPSTRKFKPIRINTSKLDTTWDRKRGAAVRLTSVLLREDDSTLERRVCESEKSTKTYTDAADWLQSESAYLRKTARLLETAVSRLSVVLERCRSRAPDVAEGT
jgi:hypothetical protein